MTTTTAYDNSVRIGYARVSTREQDHQAQLDALNAAHCREVVVETASTRTGRPLLYATLVRAHNLDLARARVFARALDLAHTYAFDLERALERARARDLARVRALDLDLVPTY